MIIDVNVSLSRWPMRKLPCDELPKLVDKLRACGVTQAWAASFDGLLHKDVGSVNARLVAECRQGPPDLLQPFGTVNPMLVSLLVSDHPVPFGNAQKFPPMNGPPILFGP